MGRLLVESIGFRDFPVVQAILLIFALQFALINLAIDILYAYLDRGFPMKAAADMAPALAVDLRGLAACGVTPGPPPQNRAAVFGACSSLCSYWRRSPR